MRIVAAQLNYKIGDLDFNSQKIIAAIIDNRSKADLIIFSELSVTGYSPEDLLLYSSFIQKTYLQIEKIAEYAKSIDVIIGAPLEEDGKLYNAGFHLSEGKIKQIVKKTLLPNYDIFEEKRYFSPAEEVKCIEVNGTKIALIICEDSWNIDKSPLNLLSKDKPSFIINISASPFSITQIEARKQMAQRIVEQFSIPFIYVNQVGANTSLIFDGNSFALNKNNQTVTYFNGFSEDIRTFQLSDIAETKENESEMSMIYNALILGVKDYFHKSGFKKAVLGLSGGIDSALTAVIAAKALGSENVTGILLPSQYSSEHSITDALDLAKNIGIKTFTLPIENSYIAIENSLKPIFEDTKKDLTEENIQARIRGLLLMAYSNKFGAILLNTSNKSETAVGYGTLYGDMCGGLAVLGDLYKTKVYELSNWINKKQEIIPYNTISKPPSAELRPDQKDQDSLPDYEILDQIIYHYIEEQMDEESICALGFDSNIVKRSLQLIKNNEYKRYQSAPILRITKKSFGAGRKMPLIGKL